MNKIKLFNRDGADLWLEKEQDLEDGMSYWNLKVDEKHLYCLQFLRVIGNYPTAIEAVDPSGGPMINIGDKFSNYKIINIINPTKFLLREGNNNNEEHSK